MAKYRMELREKDGDGGVLDALFTPQELHSALKKVGRTG